MGKINILCVHIEFEDCTEVLGASKSRETLERLAETDFMKRVGLDEWLPIAWTKKVASGRILPHENPHEQWHGEMARENSHYYTIDELELEN